MDVMCDSSRQPGDILSELLVLQAQSGNHQALVQLVDIWTPKLQSRALRLTRNHEATQEIIQETWIGIAKGLRSLKDPARFGAWSARIVHHKAADWIKAQAKQRSIETNTTDSSTLPADQPAKDQSDDIRIAIGHLDPKLREVVYLFYMDSCSLEQVALVLDIPFGTAKTRLKRARAQLKDLLMPQS